MAAIQDYATLPLFINGNFIEQKTSVSISWDGGQQRVELLNEGLGGFTPGSGSVTISIGLAVPIGGLEEDYVGMMHRGEYVTMQVPVGAQTYVGTGKITTCEISQSSGASTEGSLEWSGQFKPLE